MKHMILTCFSCGKNYPPALRFYPCDVCGNPLHVKYTRTPPGLRAVLSSGVGHGVGIGRFRASLPVPEHADFVSLGEGNTPMLMLHAMCAHTGLPNLLFKNEAMNPSWSFKDRLNSVNVTLAKAHGFKGLVASSTGNHGVSAAAYAAAAGLRSCVLFPHGTPDIYTKQVQAYGGRAVVMDWKARGDLLAQLVTEHGLYPSKSTLPAPLANPFGAEGYKTIAYEIAMQTARALPVYVFVPVGSGDNLFGIYQGFAELVKSGDISRMPKLVACEASGSSPLFDAFTKGHDTVSQGANPRTCAVSISEGIVSNLALHALRSSEGSACIVSEAEIHAAAERLAASGILAESSSCVSAAAVMKYASQSKIDPDDVIVAILTATGMRWPLQVPGADRSPLMISVDRDGPPDAWALGLVD